MSNKWSDLRGKRDGEPDKMENHFKPAVLLSVAICFMFFVFSPIETYLTNKNEFWYDIYILVPIMACVFLLFAAVCILGFLALYKLSRKLYRIALLFLFITFICSYIQGNYLIRYLPVIDGNMIDWSKYSQGRVESIILWILVSTAVILLAGKLPKRQMNMLIQVVSGCMVLMFMVTLISLCITNQGMEKKANICVTTDGEFEMSTDQNFVILLLDAADAQVFSDMVVGNPEYEAVFNDFTYYENTTSAYPYTKYNIPFLLSGMWFENKTDVNTYFEDTWNNSPVFGELENQGYSIGLYSTDTHMSENTKDRFENIGLYARKVSSYTDFSRWQIMLTGLKYAPFDLKRFSWVDPNAFEWLQVIEGDSQAFTNDNAFFYHQLLDEDITYRDDKSFKYIHLWGLHPPHKYDEDICKGDTYAQCLEGCITIVDTYLKKLREGEVYDNSIVLIVADHGYDENCYNQHPILLIKGLNEQHEFQVDDKAISFTDLPDAYERLLNGAAGETVFSDRPQTKDRRFLYYDVSDDSYMVEYQQTGKAGDMSTMTPTGKEFNR